MTSRVNRNETTMNDERTNRYDEKIAPNPASPIPGYNFEEPTASGVKAAFKRAGLGCR